MLFFAAPREWNAEVVSTRSGAATDQRLHAAVSTRLGAHFD
jgi:hypothetical protein